MVDSRTAVEVRPGYSGADRIVIVGGGFSGALLAVNLVRHAGPRAILIERDPQVGRGLAYSTAHPGHLLNVRAANMSAFPDLPDHFVDWLAARSWPGASPFVPRAIYGEYLADLLEEARREAPHRLEVTRGDAVGIDFGADVGVSLRDGSSVRGDAAVLALGNLPPLVPEKLDPVRLGARYIADPWSPDLAKGLGASDHVLVIGTGLTMVDVVLLLESSGFRGRVTALSRRGLVPRVHDSGPSTGTVSGLAERPSGELSSLLHDVRQRSEEIGWRAAVDELRPFTQDIWLAATDEQRRRFLRHLRPWWDVHRHRLAPEVAERIGTLRESGRLSYISGTTLSFDPCDGGVEVAWRPRGGGCVNTLRVDRIINCTGPQCDLSRSEEPLLLDLIRQEVARPDALSLGLAVDGQGRLLDAHGGSRGLFALGPMTRGTFWEITAVPDIRVQTWNMARRLSNAHWVGGEGL